MAKQQQPIVATADSQPREAFSLAERLFAATWSIKGGFQDDHVALKCIEAAETFERVRRERAGLRLAETA